MSKTLTLDRETGSHYYTRNGQPAFEVPKKKGGGTRKTNIRDAIEMNLLPSPTTVLQAASKPALVEWLITNACIAIATAPRKKGETDQQFVERVLKEEKQHKQEVQAAASLGSQIHAEIADILTGRKP